MKKEASFFPPFHWGALLNSPSAKVRKQKLVEASLDYSVKNLVFSVQWLGNSWEYPSILSR